ncbi:MAG: M16 family metallopeptidase [Bacteroidales bacterium]
MRKLIPAIIFFLLGLSSFAQYQFTDLTQDVPTDPAIRTGVLPNGITYYILHNEHPKNQASFYIYQNVGACLETDEQDGLAHFLEHMAFNGTNNFPGKNMLNMLERNGMKFGRDINAYTTRNETVYNLSRVPVKQEGLVDSCLLILHDWCDNLELSEAEIDAERGVISEEWRTRRDVGFRTREKTGPLMYNNTIYAYRDVIGDLDVIKNFKYDALRSFYHDWYRTDLQAVAIVGDIDVDEIEQKVIKLFSAIPAIENPQPRKDVVIPDNKETGYMQVTDPDYKTVSLSISDRFEIPEDNSIQALRDLYVRSFFTSIISQRIAEKRRENNVPFIAGRVGPGFVERGYQSFEVAVSARPDRVANAFASVYAELQRIIQFGVTIGEVERIKANMLMSAENRYNNRDKIDSDSYAKQIKSLYLEDSPVLSAEFNLEFTRQVVPTITAEEVGAVAAKYFTGKNRNYIVTGPPVDGDSLYISKAQIEEVMEKVEKAKLQPYVDKALANEKLMSTTPVPGKIIAEKKNEKLNAKEWTLSNGAKVVFKYDSYNKNSVMLLANSEGGSSQYGIDDIPSYNAAAAYVESYGIGEHDPDQIKRVLTGKSVSNTYKFGTYGESVSSNTNMGEIETMMQLTYMRFREPRFDEKMFDRSQKQRKDRMKLIPKTSDALIKDTISTIEANGNPRALKYDEKYLENMKFDRMVEIYKERFANPADFTFFIVGDVNEDTIKGYVEKYIASIVPTNNIKEKQDYHGDYFPEGENAHRIKMKMEEPKATVIIKQKTTPKYSRKASVYHSILGSILNLRYTENIREKEGGTYGVSVSARSYRSPKSEHLMAISFNCDPEKADHLKSLVYKELEIAKTSVRQDDLDKVLLNMKKNKEAQVKNAAYWMSKLTTYYRFNDEGIDTDEYMDMLDNITTKDIQKAAKRFLKKSDVLEMIILPK